MAERLNKRCAEKTRDAIQTTQLIKRLQDHALGKVKMSATQVRAAEALIRKRLPDLKAVEHTGEDGKELFPTDITVRTVKAK